MKNKISHTLFLTIMVVAGLTGLYYVPSSALFGLSYKRVDLLSDLRREDTRDVEFTEEMADTSECFNNADTVSAKVCRPVVKHEKAGDIICIEDYSDEENRGMSPFYESLIDRDRLGRPVRIAYFGDSYIEGDILTGDLRAMLQKEFGGCGVGYVSVTSATYGFRPTVRHSFKGWKSHAITDSSRFDRSLQDMSCRYFIPEKGASVSLHGQKKYACLLDTCEISTLYFISKDSIKLKAVVNGDAVYNFALPGKETLQSVSVKGPMGDVKWTVEKFITPPVFYAVTMDAEKGIALDNFSLCGSSGSQLKSVPSSTLRGYDSLRTYDLIVLQYGLNVASEKRRNYESYKTAMAKVISHLKTSFPKAGILIVGVGDREHKNAKGNLVTMPCVKSLIRYQRELAEETHVAFWNLFEAMGGEGSISRMTKSKPSMANLDYTHINFRGGAHLAKIFFNTLMYEKKRYEEQKRTEHETR